MAARLLVDYRKLALIVLSCALLYGEYLCHLSASWRWPDLPGGGVDGGGGDRWLRVLLVADPQLVGLKGEPPWPVGAVTRWDLDRYLAKTFRWALAHVGKLDAIVFLGDLIDEGSTTSYGPEYKSYVSRFRSIYPPSSAKHFLYVSGDNDVGGEGNDPVTGAKVDRFRSFFPERRVTDITEGETVLARMVVNNVITRVLDAADPEWVLKRAASAKANDTDRPLTMLFAHLPVLRTYMNFYSSTAISHFLPDLIFSAHIHKGIAAYARRSSLGESNSVQRGDYFSPDREEPIEVDVGRDRADGIVREIVVPTCSYRMGEPRMALGLASVDVARKVVVYNNLWLAERFPVLFMYPVAASISIVLFLCGRARKRERRGGRRNSAAEKRLV